MRILLVTETLVTGGAETFVLRLAVALRRSGMDVTLYVLRDDKIDHALIQNIASDVALEIGHIKFLRLVLKLDRILFRLRLDRSLLRWLQARRLKTYLYAKTPDVIHAHLFSSDIVTSKALEDPEMAIPWITTMHGDYQTYEASGRIDAGMIASFSSALEKIGRSVQHIVCITDQQVEQLGRLLPRLVSERRVSKIYNGYVASPLKNHLDAPAVLAHIPENAFVVGMVSRGVREKGWELLIAAFQELQLPNSWLVLVGDGEYLRTARTMKQEGNIVFVGGVPDPLRYVMRFDVGCLPTMFSAESLPTVIIEYLYLGKPVIASNVGAISAMLNIDVGRPAGLLIEIDSAEAMVKALKMTLKRIYDDEPLRERLRGNIEDALHKFDMDHCVHAYLDVYKKCTKEKLS